MLINGSRRDENRRAMARVCAGSSAKNIHPHQDGPMTISTAFGDDGGERADVSGKRDSLFPYVLIGSRREGRQAAGSKD